MTELQGEEIYLFVTTPIKRFTHMCMVALCLRPPLSENKKIEVGTTITFPATK